MNKENKATEVPLRILVNKEAGEYVAHALEMDVMGTGETPEEAFNQLEEAIATQLEACYEDEVSPFFRAPEEYFEKWEKLQSILCEEICIRPVIKHEQSARFASLSRHITDDSKNMAGLELVHA